MSLPSKREFLASVTNPATGEPYAKADTVGKFSKVANEYAAANADKWAEAAPVVKTARAPRPTVATGTEVSTPSAQVATGPGEAKAIRAWARTQPNLNVGERGRLHADVIDAYRAVHGEAPAAPVSVVRAERPTPLLMPARVQTQGVALIDGIEHVQDVCGNRTCSKAVKWCRCVGGPTAFVTGEPLRLV